MFLKKVFLVIGFFALLCCLRVKAQQSVSYDHQSLIINGKHTFIYSGAFHYFRCPKELWHKRFETIKAAGFNTVETYIPWNRHEKIKPKDLDDFSHIDLSEFEAWLKMAESFGFYVIVRPGPFICAEYDRGGYPGWLIPLRPAVPLRWMWLRSDDPVYLAWSMHWMKAFCNFIAPHQLSRRPAGKGGVILMQVENEYSHVYFPTEVKINVYRSLIKTALASNFKLPLVACESPEISGTSDTLIRHHLIETNNFYPYNDINSVKPVIGALRKNQPGAPLMVTELQGGWFTYNWNQPTFKPDTDNYAKGTSPAQLQNLTLYCLQQGETLLNYYMLFGGTNLNGTEGQDMQTSYDYSAPIRENGGVGEKYARVKAIGQFLKQYGERLIASLPDTAVTVTTGNPKVEIAERFTPAGERFIFIRSTDVLQPFNGKATVNDHFGTLSFNYELEPLGSKVLYLPAGQKNADNVTWLPRLNQSIVHLAVPQTVIKVYHERNIKKVIPSQWKPLKQGDCLLDKGVYDNRYIFYKAAFKVNDAEMLKSGCVLRMAYPAFTFNSLKSGKGEPDMVSVVLSGHKLLPKPGGEPGDFEIPAALLRPGLNEFLMLYENAGYPKEFVYMEKQGGITGSQLLKKALPEEQLIHWKYQEMEIDHDLTMPDTSNFSKNWQDIEITGRQATPISFHHRGIFKTIVDISNAQITAGLTAIRFAQMGDRGWLYVNGKLAGVSTSRITSQTFNISRFIKTGLNELCVIADNYDIYVKGGIGMAKLTYPENAGIQPSGLFYAGALPISSTQQTGSTAKLYDRFLTQNILSFTIPQKTNASATWILRLNSNRNCILKLNGHPIGRFWKQGLQEDFYLPECWLKHKGAKNQVTMLSNNAGSGPVVQHAVILSCTAYQ